MHVKRHFLYDYFNYPKDAINKIFHINLTCALTWYKMHFICKFVILSLSPAEKWTEKYILDNTLLYNKLVILWCATTTLVRLLSYGFYRERKLCSALRRMDSLSFRISDIKCRGFMPILQSQSFAFDEKWITKIITNSKQFEDSPLTNADVSYMNKRTGSNSVVWKASDKKLLKTYFIASHFYSFIFAKIMIM